MDDAAGATITALLENVRILRDEISYYEEARSGEIPPSNGDAWFGEYMAFGATWLGPLNKPLKEIWEHLCAIPPLSAEDVRIPTLHGASVPRQFRGVGVLRKLLDDIGTTLRGYDVKRGAMPVAFAEVATVICGWTPSHPLPNLKPYCRQLNLVLSLLEYDANDSPQGLPAPIESVRNENEARHTPEFVSGTTRAPGFQRRLGATAARGVSLLDVALLLNDGDDAAARTTRKRWQNSRNPPLPDSIGDDSEDSRTKLYAPSAIFAFVEIVEVRLKAEIAEFQKQLRHRVRPIRSTQIV